MAGALGLKLAGPRIYGDYAGRRRVHGGGQARGEDARTTSGVRFGLYRHGRGAIEMGCALAARSTLDRASG